MVARRLVVGAFLLACGEPGDGDASAGGTGESSGSQSVSSGGSASTTGTTTTSTSSGSTSTPMPESESSSEGSSDSGPSECDPPALQSGWQELVLEPHPSVRHSHAMAYDVARERTVLFGGLASGYDGDESSLRGDTWEWNGCAWEEIAVDGPSPRQGHAMVYDTTRGVVLLFGGNDTAASDELWQWDGAAWTMIGSGGPPPRWKFGMGYDSARDRVVVFGGEAGEMDDTWEWNGEAWASIDATGPSGRSRVGMVYDPERGETILFGGRLPSGDPSGETWAWDGTTWELRQDVTSEGWQRSRHGMTYDDARQVIVVFGGTRSAFLNDTLEWDGSAWTQPIPMTQGGDDGLPSRRFYVPIAYHAATQSTLLFGGFDGDPMKDIPVDDTWAYVGD